MQRPFIHPYAYSILILLSTTIIATAVFISLLLLLYYCHYYKTVATDKPLRASLLSGAAELTTHLSRLINILWLPLCRINKFGFYFPRRLLRSPILVGHQDYFLAPLPGRKITSARGVSRSQSFYFVFVLLVLFYFILFALFYQKSKKN
jgi:hypothetical protein